MPLNIRDVEDATMQANENVQQIMTQWAAQYYGPAIKAQAAMMMRSLPPEVAAKLQEMAPNEFKTVSSATTRRTE
jgi:hypothetical protein